MLVTCISTEPCGPNVSVPLVSGIESTMFPSASGTRNTHGSAGPRGDGSVPHRPLGPKCCCIGRTPHLEGVSRRYAGRDRVGTGARRLSIGRTSCRTGTLARLPTRRGRTQVRLCSEVRPANKRQRDRRRLGSETRSLPVADRAARLTACRIHAVPMQRPACPAPLPQELCRLCDSEPRAGETAKDVISGVVPRRHTGQSREGGRAFVSNSHR